MAKADSGQGKKSDKSPSVRAQRRKKQEEFEQEEAERIAKLPRLSKEKALADKAWMAGQTGGRRTRSTDPSQSLEGNGTSVDVPAANRENGTQKKSKKTTNKKTTKDPRGKKDGTTVSTAAQAKQSQGAAARPVFDRSRIDEDQPSAPPPLPSKEVRVKPKRTQAPPTNSASSKPEIAAPKRSSAPAQSKRDQANPLHEREHSELPVDISSSENDGEDTESEISDSDEGENDYRIPLDESEVSVQGDGDYEEDCDDDQEESDDPEEGIDGDEIASLRGRSAQDGSDSDDEELSDEDEDNSEIETTQRKRKAPKQSGKTTSKKQKRLEERPRMREVDVNKETSLDSKQRKAGRTSKAKRVKKETLYENEKNHHPDTQLVYASRKNQAININDQSRPLRSFAGAVIKEFQLTMVFEHGFFPANERFEMQRKLVVELAEKNKMSKHVIKRLRNSEHYAKMFIDVADLRNTQLLSKSLRAKAAVYVQTEYGLPLVVTPEEVTARPAHKSEEDALLGPTRDRVTELLKNLAYAHSGVTFDAHGKARVVRNLKIFDRPILGNVIKDAFFGLDGNKKPQIAARHPERLTSSDYYNAQELEVAESMVALACAGIAEALRCWETGKYVVQKLSSSMCETQYNVARFVLGKLLRDRPKRYHQALHNLYLVGTGGIVHTQQDTAVKEGAMSFIKWDDEPEDDNATTPHGPSLQAAPGAPNAANPTLSVPAATGPPASSAVESPPNANGDSAMPEAVPAVTD